MIGFTGLVVTDQLDFHLSLSGMMFDCLYMRSAITCRARVLFEVRTCAAHALEEN